MRRRFGRRRGSFRRSVSWIDGINTFDTTAGQSSRTVPLLSLAATAPNLWGAAIGLVIPTDLPDHGGEDAVLTRVRGRLGFMGGRRDAGAGFANYGFQMRVLVTQSDWLPSGGVTPFDFCSAAGLGNDDILFSHETVVPDEPITATGHGYSLMLNRLSPWLELDVKAKRKLQKDRMIVLWFQTALAAGTTAVDFQLLGGLRTLLMRPR